MLFFIKLYFFVNKILTNFIFLFSEMRPADPRFRTDKIRGMVYNDFEPLTSVRVPDILTGDPPAPLDDIYEEFRDWIYDLPDITTYMGNSLDMFEDRLYISQLRALRLAVMAEFFMRHPRYEIQHRR